MEPLLGGRLANPPKDILSALGGKDPVQAALDFLWDMPEVGVVLSGMSNLQQLEQNISYAEASSVAVSYTHLDVYKRQDRRICDDKRRRTISYGAIYPI